MTDQDQMTSQRGLSSDTKEFVLDVAALLLIHHLKPNSEVKLYVSGTFLKLIDQDEKSKVEALISYFGGSRWLSRKTKETGGRTDRNDSSSQDRLIQTVEMESNVTSRSCRQVHLSKNEWKSLTTKLKELEQARKLQRIPSKASEEVSEIQRLLVFNMRHPHKELIARIAAEMLCFASKKLMPIISAGRRLYRDLAPKAVAVIDYVREHGIGRVVKKLMPTLLALSADRIGRDLIIIIPMARAALDVWGIVRTYLPQDATLTRSLDIIALVVDP